MPEVSRWTWLLGIGWVDVLLERNAEAVPWLQRSIAITPASGRSYMLLAVAYLRLGRLDEAKAAMAKGLAIRPGSTAANVKVPTLDTSEADPYRRRTEKILQQMVELGLPQG